MTPSKTFFWFCISFIVGIALQSTIKIPQIFLWGILILAVLIIIARFVIREDSSGILFAIRKHLLMGGFCVLFLVLGILRLQISEFNIKNNKLQSFNDNYEKITFIGRIIDEPDIRSGFQKFKLGVGNGIILVTASRYPEYNYSDRIKITGKLKSPPELEGFNYKDYLLKDGIYSVMDFPKIELILKERHYNIFTFIYEKILFAKGKLIGSLNMNFSSPDNEVLKGIVFGDDKNTPKDLKDKFNATGLSHITAVSGGNIIILIYVLTYLLLFCGLWRRQALYVSLVFVWFYIALVGFPSSGVRAAIMGSIFLLSEIFGRQNTSSRTIVLAGALMLLQNPLLLFYDVGFQLSFLAVMGIIHLKPLIDALFLYAQASGIKLKSFTFTLLLFRNKDSRVKSFLVKRLKYLADIVLVTLAAQILTLPVIAYSFGTVSLVAPITNLLILPMVSLLMVFGILTSIFGTFSGFLGWIFALPCYFAISYLLKVLDIFYQPWAVKSLKNISWIWILFYYFIFAALIFYSNRKLKQRFLGY